MDFDALYREHADKIYAYIYRRTSDPHITQDLCSVTFLKALEADRRSRCPVIHPSGWLFRIAHNLVVDHYRARDRAVEVALLDDDSGEECDLLLEYTWNEDGLALHMLLASLTEVQRRAVLLRYAGEYSFDEIAAIEGITVFAVKARVQRGIVSLRLLSSYML